MNTTKQGASNEALRVPFGSYTGIQFAWKRPHMLNASDLIQYKARAAQAAGGALPAELSTQAGIGQVLQFVKENDGSPSGTDCWKQITNSNALTQSSNIAVSRGPQKLPLEPTLLHLKHQ